MLLVVGIVYSIQAAAFHFVLNDERMYVEEAYRFAHFGEVPRVYPLTPMLLSFLTLAPSYAWEALFKGFMVSTCLALALAVYRVNGFASALFFSLSPMWVFLSSHVMTEQLFAFTLLACVALAREFVERPRLLIATALGLALFLSYLAKASSIPFIAGLAIYLAMEFAKRGKRFASLTAVALATFLAGVAIWSYLELSTLGSVATSLRYTASFINIHRLSLNPKLLAITLAKLVLGATLCVFPYLAVALRKTLESGLKGALRALELDRCAKLAVALYVATVSTYYIALSLTTETPESIDHIARYLMPILPLIRIDKTIKPIDIAALALSIAIGTYLHLYASTHAYNPTTWIALEETLRA